MPPPHPHLGLDLRERFCGPLAASFDARGEVAHELGVLLDREDFFVAFVQRDQDIPGPSCQGEVDDLVAVFLRQPLRQRTGFGLNRNALHSGYSSPSMTNVLPSLTAMATTRTVTISSSTLYSTRNF